MNDMQINDQALNDTQVKDAPIDDAPINHMETNGANINGTEIKNSKTGDTEKPGLLELIYGTLFNPVATFSKVANDPPLFYSFLIFIAVLVLKSLVDVALPGDIAGMPAEISAALTQAGPVFIIVEAIMSILFWFLQAGILQVISELFGGKGRAVSLLTILALASLPGVIYIPFKVAGYFLAASFAGRFLTIAGSILAMIWWFILLVLGVREVQFFSTGRAVTVVAAPLVVLVVLMVLLVVTLLAFAAPFLGQGAI